MKVLGWMVVNQSCFKGLMTKFKRLFWTGNKGRATALLPDPPLPAHYLPPSLLAFPSPIPKTQTIEERKLNFLILVLDFTIKHILFNLVRFWYSFMNTFYHLYIFIQ